MNVAAPGRALPRPERHITGNAWVSRRCGTYPCPGARCAGLLVGYRACALLEPIRQSLTSTRPCAPRSAPPPRRGPDDSRLTVTTLMHDVERSTARWTTFPPVPGRTLIHLTKLFPGAPPPTSQAKAPRSAKRGRPPANHPVGRLPPSALAAELVGLGRFERPTSRLSGVRSNQLSYRPRVRHRRTEDGERTRPRRRVAPPLRLARFRRLVSDA
jgi:hypothetical protein